jgi:hypothetical protein
MWRRATEDIKFDRKSAGPQSYQAFFVPEPARNSALFEIAALSPEARSGGM